VIEWAYPQLLWLLLLVPVIGAFVWRRERQRRTALAAFAESPLLPRLAPAVDPRRRGAREVVRLCALVFLIVALAGPQWGSTWEEVKREGVDLIVALDTSRSMLATDVKPSRIDRAKLAIRDLVSKLEGDRIGLVAFSGTAFLECPLTLDYGAFEASLASTSVGSLPRGGTNLGAAIDAALDAFEARQGKYEAMILITDGESTEGDAAEAAKRAADNGVKIFTVGIGTAEGELIPLGQGETYVKDRQGQVVKSRLDEKGLEDVALATGGAYVHGAGASIGLDEIFDGHIAKMERRELQSTLQRRFENRFQVPLALALLLLLFEPLLGERRFAVAAVLLLLSAARSASADQVAEGNKLYHEHKYEEASQRYGEALVDSPGAPILRFNLAAAQYKLGRYADAVASLQKIGASGDDKLDARVAYNLGNSLFRFGESQASSKPADALKSYDAALAAYKRAMGADSNDVNAKVNHEVVERKKAELEKKLEEEKKKQEEQQQQQQDQQQGQDQQQQDQGQEDQQKQGGGGQESNQSSEQQQKQQPQPKPGEGERKQDQGEQQQAQQPQANEPQPAQPQPAQPQQGAGGGEALAGEQGEKDLDRQEAYGVLDTARSEEVRPDELHQLRAPAGIAEPAQDW